MRKRIAYLILISSIVQALSQSCTQEAKKNTPQVHPKKKQVQFNVKSRTPDLRVTENVFFADISYGKIGASKQGEKDRAYDNIFHIFLSRRVSQHEEVFLAYELKGVADHASICRSINDGRAIGGHLVRFSKQWRTQREAVSKLSLHTGDNVIRFSLPDSAHFFYEIRSVRLQIKHVQRAEPVLVNAVTTTYQGNYQLKGILNEKGFLLCNGRPLNIQNGEFDTILSTPHARLSLRLPNGETWRSKLRVSLSISTADTLFTGRRRHAGYAGRYLKSKGLSLQSTPFGVGIYIPAGALHRNETISITPLAARDIAPLNADLVNITAFAEGYRFLPHGSHFDKQVSVRLPYDSLRLPEGYTKEDIHTFYFDENRREWMVLPTDTAHNMPDAVMASSTHFTDMIAGIIKVPESPQTQGYTPTTIKDYKAADPSTGIPIIAPPTANSMGNASMSFPIKIPKGRNGMQPNLNLVYSSDSGNGWLGMGWSMSMPSVGIDTRWGVPRYDRSSETETYVLNGEQLAPVNNRVAFAGRVSNRQYHKRVEGGFERIIRHGDNPTNYWWQVTNKYGVSSYYGGTPDKGVISAAILKDLSGNIAQWMLVETRDLHDNFIGYNYRQTQRTVVSGGSLQGTQIYPESIHYTGSGHTPGKFSIEFIRDSTTRKDIEVSARLGFLSVSADRLTRINIIDHKGKQFRYYELAYDNGAFNKTLLKSVTERDDQSLAFYNYGFQYFNEVAATDGVPINTTENWSPPSDGVRGDLPNILPGFTDESSTLSTTKTRSFGAGLTLTVGITPIPIPLPNKDFTIGGNISHDDSHSDGIVTMVDINGDGLPDKVFKKNGNILYRPNLGLNMRGFGDIHVVAGINSFSKGNISTNKSSIQVYPFGAFIGRETSTTKQTTDTYFSDFNGDGLIDLASDGQVYFNHINKNGDPEFTPNSTLTPSPILQGNLDRAFLVPDLALQKEQELQYPLEDVIRFWEAPYDGSVDISGTVRLLPPLTGLLNPKEDGVQVSIETRGGSAWTTRIQSGDYSSKTPASVSNLPVVKGRKIFFRVQSVYNGNNDVVQWDPIITYHEAALKDSDANNRQYGRYKASEDFVLDNLNGVLIPKSGMIKIGGKFAKAATSDTVKLLVRVYRNSTWQTLFSKSYSPAPAASEELNLPAISLNEQDLLSCIIQTDSYIDRAALSWSPHYLYTSFLDGSAIVDVNGKPLLDAFIAPENKNYNYVLARAKTYKAPQTGKVAVLPNINAVSDTGTVVFTVKGADTIFAKRFIKFSGGTVSGNKDSVKLTLKAGTHYYFDFATGNPSLALALKNTSAFVYRDSLITQGAITKYLKKTDTVAAGLYTEPANRLYGAMFRGWGQFQYKGDKGTATIDETKLNTNQWANYPNDPKAYPDTNALVNLPNPVLVDVVSINADAKRNLWSGMDTAIVVTSSTIGSSRLFLHDVSVDSLMQGAGLTAVSKIRKSKGKSTWAGIGFEFGSASGSSSSSTETTLLDMIDMNGDRYPDVINENNIQYSLPSGALEPSARAPYGLGGASSSGNGKSGGLGGHFSPKFGNNTTAGNATQAEQDASQSIGLSGNVGKSDQRSTSAWIDINGDGLPDKVFNNGLVALNLGYTFANAEDWHIAGIDVNHGTSIGGGFGINLFQGSYEAGAGLTRSTGTGTYTLSDVNGDGLIDQVHTDGVQLNNGNSFAEKVSWAALTHFNDNVSTGESLNLAYTWSHVIPILPPFPIFLKIAINPSVYAGWGLSREQYQIMDIDGDGFPDLLHSETDGDLQVNRSIIGRTNMLMRVDRPLHSSIAIDYKRVGNTYDMPESKWVMASVKLIDSVGGNGADTMRYSYNYTDGFYNRREREFYGFKTVSTNELNTQAKNAVYRTSIQQFFNRNYYTKGLPEITSVTDAAGKIYMQTNDLYELRFVQDSVFFPALRQTTKENFEGQDATPAQTAIYYDYDALGNIVSISDIGDGNFGDEIKAAVTYFSVDQPYIKAIPRSITVSNQGIVKRSRTQEINTATGDITKITQLLADGTASVYDIEYDKTYGNLLLITRPANYNKERLWYKYTYDGDLNTYVTKVVDAYGYSSSSEYDPRFGVVTKTVSLTNEPMVFKYDERGRLTKVTGPYEIGLANTDHTISFDYHDKAQIPFAVTSHYDPAHPENVQGIRIIHFMDGFGRTIQIKKDISLFVSKNQEKDAMSVSGRVTYDAFGRIVKNYYPVTEDINAVRNNLFNPAIGNFSDSSRYDILDRPLKSVLADGATTKYVYSISSGALLSSVTDPLNHVHEVLTDVRERKREDRALSGQAGPIITKFSYSALNELIKVEDAGGNVSSFTYDNLGRKTSATHPDAGTTTYTYDPAGNLIQKITAQIAKQIPNGGAINYQYDHERLIGIDYPIQYQNKVNYEYGAPNTGDRAGRLILQKDASGGREFFYGKLGEITKEIRTVMISKVFYTTYVSEQKYDTWNRITSMSYPDGEVLTYSYNKGGLLDSITGNKFGKKINYVAHIGYDEYEQRVYLKYGNNTETKYTYDTKRRRLSSLTATTASGRLMMNNGYGYDAVSNILNITNSVGAVTGQLGGSSKYDYTYDGLYRLNTAKGFYRGAKDSAMYSLAIGYDNLYNVTGKKMTDMHPSNSYDLKYTYGANGPHQLAAIGADTYQYDADGNVTKGGGRQNYWDDEDRLMAVIKNNVLSEYTYDAAGERVVKSSGNKQGIWVNNAPAGTINHRDNYTVYVSPYLVCTRTGFTKHFYIESQRIATQLGKGKFTNISFPQTALSAGDINYIDRAINIEKQRINYYASLHPIAGPPTNKFFYVDPRNSKNAPPILIDTLSASPPGWPGNTTPPSTGPPIFLDSIPSRDKVRAGYGYESKDKTEETDRYFYHSDHLGSTNYITDISGEVSQHFEYSAFGETLFDEHRGITVTQYLFNAKEKDEETGLYYYGARYYDPKLSNWLSVDPLKDKFPGLSPYNFVLQNPVKLVDPDGNCPICAVPLIVEGIGLVTDVVVAAVGETAIEAEILTVVGEGTAISEGTVGIEAGSAAIEETGAGGNIKVETDLGNRAIDSKQFNGRNDTFNQSSRQAFRNAKEQNGIPRSQQPDRVIKPNTPEGNEIGLDSRNVKQSEFINSEGQKVSIRQDKSVKYGDGGKGDQSAHYNAGQNPQQPKDLTQHHYWSKNE